jgi:hypothetical protein
MLGRRPNSNIREIFNFVILVAKSNHCPGKMDLENLDVDFIEDMMLKSKPLQSVLNDIRNRQKVKLALHSCLVIIFLLLLDL